MKVQHCLKIFTLLAFVLSTSPSWSHSLTTADLLHAVGRGTRTNDPITTWAFAAPKFTSFAMDPRCHPQEGPGMATLPALDAAMVTRLVTLTSKTLSWTPLAEQTRTSVFHIFEATDMPREAE